MKILYGGALDLGVERGDTLHFAQLAGALKRRGHNLAVVGYGKEVIPELENLYPRLVSIVDVSKIRVPMTDLKMMIKLRKMLANGEYDFVYQRGIPYLNRFSKRRDIPVIVEVNGLSINETILRGASSSRLRYVRHRESNIIKGASLIVTVSEGVKSQMAADYGVDPSKCFIIPNAADTDLFRPLDAAECCRQLDIEFGPLNILFVGAYQMWVDFRSMLQAIRLLTKRVDRIRCWIVGDGVRFEEIRKEISRLGLDNLVTQVGRIPHNEVPIWISASDVCLIPILPNIEDHYAGSPLKLFEYMACQRTVVGTDMPGIREHIEPHSAGLLYSAGDSNSLMVQILRLYQDEILKKQLSANALNYILENRTWDNVAKRIEALAENLIANNGQISG